MAYLFPLVGLAPMRSAPARPALERLVPVRPAPVKLSHKKTGLLRSLAGNRRTICFASSFSLVLLSCCALAQHIYWTQRPMLQVRRGKDFPHRVLKRKPASCGTQQKIRANKKIPFAHTHTHTHMHLYGLLLTQNELGSFFAYSVARHTHSSSSPFAPSVVGFFFFFGCCKSLPALCHECV